jgi:serine/threonine-protein kinase
MTDPRVGTELAGHRVESVIGRGGMSVVYLAEHIGLRRKVALKVLGPELTEDDAFRERFIRESRITAGLDHPNIVTVYDAGESDGVLYISMRYVEGTDLEHLLRIETRLDPGRAVSLVSQAAAALDAAHEAGLVHRDVKPGNILLTTEPRSSTDRAYLSDFGVTKRVETGASLTRTGQFVGTVDYVAPEQIQGGDVDGRADVYSLACVLYRCLIGEVPFPRDTEVATIYAHLQDPPPTPSERRPELPVGFDAPISRALAKSRDDRFDTCRRFAEAAGAALHPLRPVDVAPGEPTRPRTSRRRIAFASGSLVVVAGVAIAVILLLQPGDRGRSSVSRSPTTPGPLPELTWRSVVDRRSAFDGPDDQEIADAALVNDAIVAVGRDDAGGDADAAVWTSSDGRRWTRVPGGTLGRIGEQRMDAVAAVGEELVAVGSERTGGDTDPAVWRSADDGTTWDRVEGAASGLHEAGDQEMRVVVEATPGMVAAGFETSQGDLDAAVWTSKDGSSWIPLTLASLEGPGDQQILGAATLGEQLVAVGSSTSETGDLDAAVWVRSAGSWTKVDEGSLGGPGDQQINAIVAGGTGSVAVGTDTSGGDLDAAVWTSTDGRRWDRVPATGAAFGGAGEQRMSTVTWVGAFLVAGGSSAAVGSDPDGAIWVSADGVRWKRTPVDVMEGLGLQRISSLVPIDSDRLLAAGSLRSAQDGRAAAWIARLAFSDPSP